MKIQKQTLNNTENSINIETAGTTQKPHKLFIGRKADSPYRV